MSRDTAREAVNKKLVQKQDVPKVFNGFLGNYENVVIVPGRLNYVYVTMADGMVTQAYNVIAPTILKLPVVCGYDQNQLSSGLLKVISVRNIPRQTNSTAPTTNMLNNHHKSHEWMATDGGTDPTMIELRQFMPLRPTPVSPQSIHVNRGVLHIGGAWKVVGGQTVLLSQYVPSNSELSGSAGGEYSGSNTLCRYVTISIDAASGSAVATSGSSKLMTAINLTDIPEAPAGNYPICAVQLYSGQTDIVEARTRTDLIDLRYGMSSALTPVHNNLGGLNAGDYQHLTAAQKANVISASGSGQNGYLTSEDWLRFNATSGSGGISDAPIDGKQYGRKDGAWTEIVAGGSQVVPLAHVPVTNFYLTGYDSASGSWTSGSVVGGTSGSGGGIEEAPNDGKQYGRQSLGWTEIVSGSGASGGADVLMVQVFS